MWLAAKCVGETFESQLIEAFGVCTSSAHDWYKTQNVHNITQ